MQFDTIIIDGGGGGKCVLYKSSTFHSNGPAFRTFFFSFHFILPIMVYFDIHFILKLSLISISCVYAIVFQIWAGISMCHRLSPSFVGNFLWKIVHVNRPHECTYTSHSPTHSHNCTCKYTYTLV